MALSLAVGTLLGFLTGLGIGGGSLLILYLTIFLGMAQETARGINLLFFLPSAVIACCFRWRQGCLKLGKVWPAIAAGAVSAGVFSFLGMGFDPEVLKTGFGFLLIGTGLRELFYKPGP